MTIGYGDEECKAKWSLRCKAVMKRDDDAWRLFLDSTLVVDLIGQRSTFAVEALIENRDIFCLSISTRRVLTKRLSLEVMQKAHPQS
jgi:hypothetical protein